MISQSEKHETLLNRLQEFQRRTKGEFPSWVVDLQKQSFERAAKLGFPTLKDEEWKYTNIQPIVERVYHFPPETKLREVTQLKQYVHSDDINIVLVNGSLAQDLSNLKKLPLGLKILTLQEAFKNNGIELQNIFKKYDIHQEGVFVALTKALAHNGVYIEITDKAIIEKVIHVVHVTSTTDTDIITTPYTMIKIGKSAEATILESYLGFNPEVIYFTNALTDILIHENTTLKYCKAQSECLKSYHIGATRVWQERDSNFLGFSLMVGGEITRNNLDVVLNGKGASAILNGLYCVNGTQLVDNHTLVDHRQPNCTSNQLYKGILNGSSRGVFNGKIFVQPIAQKTNSYQLNKNLLLGKESQVNTKPQLEIEADDVKCTHGATIGQLNEDEIFYLQSRAIAHKDAIRMLSHGFVDDILSTIQNQTICQKLNLLLEPTFAAL